MSAAEGTVAAAFRWPVKSMKGERVEALELATHGAAGDRAHALADARPGKDRLLSGREAPRLLLWSAATTARPSTRPTRPSPR